MSTASRLIEDEVGSRRILTPDCLSDQRRGPDGQDLRERSDTEHHRRRRVHARDRRRADAGDEIQIDELADDLRHHRQHSGPGQRQ